MSALADSSQKVAHCTQVHNMWPFGPLVSKSCYPPPPPPLVTCMYMYIHTHLSLYHHPSFKVAYVNPTIQPSILVVTNPIPLPAPIMFIINCTPPYPYLYLWPLLTSYIHLFVHFILFLSLLTWSETKMKRLCIMFQRIQGVPQQIGGSCSREATRMKTGNRYREIEIRLLLIA